MTGALLESAKGSPVDMRRQLTPDRQILSNIIYIRYCVPRSAYNPAIAISSMCSWIGALRATGEGWRFEIIVNRPTECSCSAPVSANRHYVCS